MFGWLAEGGQCPVVVVVVLLKESRCGRVIVLPVVTVTDLPNGVFHIGHCSESLLLSM